MASSDKRKKIIQASEKLFLKRRFHEVTLDEVARAAGVGKGTIYLYFKDKDDLFLQTSAWGFDELAQLIQSHKVSHAPFEENLMEVCEAARQFFKSHHPMIHLLHEQEMRTIHLGKNQKRFVFELMEKVDSALAELLLDGVAQKRIRSDVDVIVLAKMLLGTLLTSLGAFSGAPEKTPDIRTLLNIYIHGAGRQSR